MSERPHFSLAMLQNADSAFPTGAISFSWGLEALANCGAVHDAKGVADFLTAQISHRWANIDRVMLIHAHAAADDMARLATLDVLLDAQSLAAEQRMGSRRMGAAFLGIHVKLGTPLASRLRDQVTAGALCGHVPIVQGAIWRQMGFSSDQVQIMAAHGLCTGVLSAAIRLSLIGHVDAQKIHSRVGPQIDDILTTQACPAEEAHGFTPQIEIASMIHETDQMRLFVN